MVSECPKTTQQAIVNGASQETYLGLADAEVRAIVHIVDGIDPEGALCSGILIDPHWVATAQHCLEVPNPVVLVAASDQGAAVRAAILRVVAHPSEDVALLEIDTSDGATDGIDGIRTGPSVGNLSVGDVADLAGYGQTETGASRDLRFVAEQVTMIDEEAITMNGFGSSGACLGDSGGPLLVRGPDGSPIVAGVLSLGSASCRDDDTFVRLDVLESWLVDVVGSGAPHSRPCGSITATGRCLYGSALWCAGDMLAAQACSNGQRCGWDIGVAGFRCIQPLHDPCDGVDTIGGCRQNVAMRCELGSLQSTACGACQTCLIDGRSGAPRCAGKAE
jgi:secreted trypsin-like serine protease